jgi:hypothetical protein
MFERKSTPWIIAAVLAVSALVALGWWWLREDEAGGENDTEAATAKVDPAEALRRKQAAREELPPLKRVAIGGRVTRADDGAPIPGAVVLVSRKGIIQGQAPSAGEQSRPLMAITDAGGGWKLPGVDPGGYLLSASAEGFIPGTRTDVRVSGREDQVGFDLELAPGGQPLYGKITDIGGGPIEGVLVRASEASSGNFGFDNAAVGAVTDEEGNYRLHLAKGRYGVATHHLDYVTEARLTELTEGGRKEDFRLVPGGTIEGVVLARPEGEPVAGAQVSFTDSRNQDMGMGATTNISADGSVVVTDEQGRFRLTGLRAGVVSISARAKGHASLAPEEVPLGIGEQVTEVEVWVDTAHSISGFVVPKGAPDEAIEGVLVGAWQLAPPGLLVASAPTASDGYFEILGVPPGTWQVGAIGEDHLATLTGATAVIRDADVEGLLIELDTGIYVRGRVDPGMAAQVKLKPNPENVSLGNIGELIGDVMATTRADEHGEFELGPINPGGGFGGRSVTVVASNEEGFEGEVQVDLGREDVEGVVVSMTKGAAVSGTVLDSNGVPQAGVIVSVTPAEAKDGAMNFNFGGLPGGEGSPTGEDGRFAVRGLELGKHLVLVKDSKGRPMSWEEGSGPNDAEGKPEPIEIELEDTVNEEILNLRVVPRDGVISGVVLDAEGLPVMDAWVRASLDIEGRELWQRPGADEPERIEGVVPERDERSGPDFTRSSFYSEPPVLTDENGLFVIKDLRSDRNYHLVAEGERGGARAMQESVAPGSRVTLTLAQLSGIDGVVSLEGEPVSDYQLEARGPSLANKRINHPEGKFRLDRLDPGDYELFVRSDRGSGSAEVSLGEAGREQVKIELEPGGTLRGRVVGDKDGEPIAGLMIMVVGDGRISATAAASNLVTGQGPKTDRDGRFEIENVAPGKGSISFIDRDVQLSGSAELADVSYELDPGEELDLGEIRALQGDSVPSEERGDLQMRTRTATWADRPRPPGTKLEDEVPDEAAEADSRMRLWVTSIEVGGVAEAAGIAPGDEILSVDGQSVATVGAAMVKLRLSSSRVRVGQELSLELARGEEHFDVRLEAVGKDAKPAPSTAEEGGAPKP